MVARIRGRRAHRYRGAWLLLLAACSGGAPVALPPPDRPPTVGQVRDGIGADIDQQEMRTSLFANWDEFVDPEGFPVVYEWALGRLPGGTDVMPWTPVGGATRAKTQDVDLPAGFAVYVSVRATDIAGNRSAVATSDGVVLGQRPEPPPAHPVATPPTDAGEGPARQERVERFGITWTFERAVPCGRFVTGDWWVLGPVHVVAIAPPSGSDDGRVRHGSMIDPDPRAMRQGYDSAMVGANGGSCFDPAANVALGVARDRPLRLEPGMSLVSTVSHPLAGQLPQLETCAVLTCVAEPPPADAFRPPYCGQRKRPRWRASQLDLSRLARLQPPPDAPAPADLLPHFERTWLDHLPGAAGRYLHPRLNMPDYGREIADLVGRAALVLQLDHEPADKVPLVHALVQVGIDLAGIVDHGGRFLADGGSGSGRKFPILFAGALLGDAELLRLVREQKTAFAEDVQTFYVAQTAAGVWNHGHGDYGPEDEGLPEWGNRHGDDPSLDRKPWTSDPYRRCCTANVWLGFVLATRIMGLREAWGHEALFDYVDRYLQVEAPGSWTHAFDPFAGRMWARYRADF
ncbi:MAG: hypothetical protein KF830_08305 [Planctomycetes bacterium]|nr:hypothetical protein [Planctomycetota bacterium]